MAIISERTLMPISLVLIFLGGVAWLTSIAADVKFTSNTIEKVEIKQERYNATLSEINSRLSRIEGKLENKRQ